MKKNLFKQWLSRLLIGVVSVSALTVTACKEETQTEESEPTTAYTSVDLVTDNTSEYTVVMPENADECIEFAVSELVTFFAQATDYTLAVATDENVVYNESSKIISVGETTAWKQTGIELSLDEFGYDGAFLTRKGNQVFLCGAKNYGALNAVYELLSLQFNYEAYSVDEIYIDQVSNAKLVELDNVKDIPAIRTRTSANQNVGNSEIYAARLRNAYSGNAKRYGDESGEYAIRAHTIENILPKGTYQAEHEDWYSADGTQVCIVKYFTDDEFKSTFLTNLKEKILNYPDSTAYQLGMSDNNGVHDRPETAAFTEAHGGNSGVLMMLANDVAREIKAWLEEMGDPRADVYRINVLAYIKYEAAPVTFNNGTGEYEPVIPEVVADDNVSVMLCPYYAENAYAMTDEEHNSRYAVLMKQWSVITDNLEIWFYSTNFRNFMIPYNNFQAYRESCIGWAEYGVTYVLENGGTSNNPFQIMKNYVYAKLLWDPYQDYNVLVDNFIYYYYKEAAPYIREYYDLMRVNYMVVEKQLEAEGKSLSSGMYETGQQAGTTVYSVGYTKKINQLMDKALAAAEAIEDPERRETVLRRVRTEALSPRYFLIQLHSSTISESETVQYIDQFETWASDVGMSWLSENWRGIGTTAQVVAAWRERLNLLD